MTYEVYRYVFLGAGIASAVMAAISVILFFTLRIPKVISDLTGRTAKKAIEQIRRQNEESGDKTYKSSAVNLERGKVTDKISESGRVLSQGDSPFGTGVITEKIAYENVPMHQAEETTVLGGGDETTVLAAEETTVLTEDRGETAVLQQPVMNAPIRANAVFEIAYEITYINTNEVIT